MRIVLDSNILVRAAWKADGLASQLLRSVLEGPHRLIVSPFILGEVARVLAYPRIQSRWGLSAERIQRHVNRLAAVAEIVETASVDRVVPDDPDDDFVLHTAVAGRADVLCTRDSHLLDSRIAQYCTRRGIRIMDDIELYGLLGPRLPSHPAAFPEE
jgi:putative PIN family toxin of toxin-antitoxin system